MIKILLVLILVGQQIILNKNLKNFSEKEENSIIENIYSYDNNCENGVVVTIQFDYNVFELTKNYTNNLNLNRSLIEGDRKNSRIYYSYWNKYYSNLCQLDSFSLSQYSPFAFKDYPTLSEYENNKEFYKNLLRVRYIKNIYVDVKKSMGGTSCC